MRYFDDEISREEALRALISGCYRHNGSTVVRGAIGTMPARWPLLHAVTVVRSWLHPIGYAAGRLLLRDSTGATAYSFTTAETHPLRPQPPGTPGRRILHAVPAATS